MSFRRTNAGMSGVDAVVFVEGGDAAFTLEQLSQGLYNNQAYDIKYWQIVFASLHHEKHFIFVLLFEEFHKRNRKPDRRE